ncbi:thiamine pyrophosphate-binding protein [Amycolatopsis oliviviridis]|uniref:Acetolactate synthase I/II/III large subunit n=1 Tax=Amycolatopsis oliviviridis TaxID=1471590 RepID=A0ABQ3M4R5_9PSEU|nr:acetolactate synthase I/II/III large subunit [Amycolatopsis oliviviridis]
MLSNFRIGQDALATAVGAVPDRVHGAPTAVADTVRAYRTAVQQRRTVVLNLPLDVQAQEAPHAVEIPEIRGPAPIRPDAEAVAKLADLLAGARRPVFIAGRGARASAAPLKELAEVSGALLATSAVAHGLFHDDPYSVGISGGFSSPRAADLIANADLVIGWGCALNMWTTRHGKLLGPGAWLVQVDVDQSGLGAHRPIALGVVGDVTSTAADVHAELGRRGHHASREVPTNTRWNDVPYNDLSGDGRIDPRTLSRRLDELLPTERVLSIDSGNFMGYPSAYLSVPDENGFCFTQAFQSIGLGLGTAIGAALARPERLPVLGVGDGGFHMAVSELETAVRLRIPLVVVVYNDAAYGAEIHHFGEADMTTVRFPDTDIAAIGRGCGCDGVTVRSVEDLAAVKEWLGGPRDAPLVVDAKIADDGGSWWLAEAFRH